MTVGSKLHQTLAGLEGAKAQLDMFVLDTENTQAKATFARLSQILENDVLPPLRQRINEIEHQEPQFRVKNQAQQQAGKQQH